MRKGIVIWMLILSCLLSGCGAGEQSADPTDSTIQPATRPTAVPEEQPVYDWMAGESPVPNLRVGRVRQGLQHIGSTTSEKGTYFVYKPSWMLDVTPPSPWILYTDHGSDMVIKLCGRPDCTHDTTDCNAYVDGGEYITYYEGYLYIFDCGYDGTGISSGNRCTLLQMNPDGTKRTEVFDFREFAKQQGNDGAVCEFVADGYCMITTIDYITAYQSDGSISTTSEHKDTYRYKLDGSMKQPEKVTTRGVPLYECGDVLLLWDPVSEKGGEYGSYWDYDIATDTRTFLTDHPGTAGYYGKEVGFYFKDGSLHRLTYATGKDEVVMKTELTGKYDVKCFPDCFVLADCDFKSEKPDMNLYFYNWAFQLVDTVKINYPCDLFMVSDVIIGETPSQFILSNGSGAVMPKYYINKSELGTGQVEIHTYNMPDLSYYLQEQAEEQEDQEWFENG